jgi:uncharacterized UPF0146 family protein
VNRRVELLTREGCTICAGAATRLAKLADELGFELTVTDVDAVAAAGDSALRCETPKSNTLTAASPRHPR